MLHKSIIMIVVLMLEVMAAMPKQQNATYTSSPITEFSNLSKSWYLAAEIDDTYWGLYAKKGRITVGTPADTIDTLGIGVYQQSPFFGIAKAGDPNFQVDIDSVKRYLNTEWKAHPDIRGSASDGLFMVGAADSRRDTINTYIQIFKLDAIYTAIAIPKSRTIKIYKNHLGIWRLNSTITTSSDATLLTLTCKDNTIRFVSNDTLYELTDNCNTTTIIPNVLGYFVDNNGIWLTNPSGQLSYYNGIRITVKTSGYVHKIFAVNPVDTTFFYDSRKISSTGVDVDYCPIASLTTSFQSGFITDNTKILSTKGDFLCYLPRSISGTIRDLIVDYATQQITYQVADAGTNGLVKYDLNYAPFFYNTHFTDSLGLLNEAKQINYVDTLHAFDHSSNSQLTYSIIQNPIGINLVDTIFSIDTSLSTGTYTIKFQVRDNFSIPIYDTITWNLKIYSRNISMSKSVLTTASEGTQYTQAIITSDPDDDSSYLSYSKLPSWLSMTRISKNQFAISGEPLHTSVDTTVKIILTDSSNHYDVIQKQNVTPTFDTLTYNIAVSTTNVPPVFTSTPITTVNEGQQYSYQVQAVDDQPITYTLIVHPATMTMTSSGLISWLPTLQDTGSNLVISITATDTYGAFTKQTYNLIVKHINGAPVIVAITNDTSINETDSITLSVTASDPEGTTPIVKWYSGTTLLAQANTYKITTNYTSAGTQTFKVVVSDGELAVERTVTLTVSDKNRIPVVPNDTTITFKKLNTPIAINAKVIDPDGDELIYSIDTSTFNVSSLVVEIEDSTYKVSLKKAISDTLTFIISDGKSQVVYHVIVLAEIPTSIITATQKLTNSFSISNGMVKYSVAKQNNVKLIIFSMNGSTVYKFNHTTNAGTYSSNINLTSGSYVYQFSIGGDFVTANKMQIIR
ncbi:MAG: Ig-like domain-containing protein [Candidatus Nanoarchaeia archaeon]|nr:Ig-like domain-containing protein [Candidatus Nanoarchaeia archaeon]